MDAVAWRESRPKKRMGSGALIRDDRGRILLVEPTYKPTWEVPGGSVERTESPRAACARELVEELGLELAVGRLLCVEWQGDEPGRSESLMFLYDGGVLPAQARLSLPPGELSSARFVDIDDVDALLQPRLARRVRAALVALGDGSVAEMETGQVTGR